MERSGAARADVDLVTLQPLRIGAFWPFFVHGNTDAGLPKALGKTQATDPASNDDHVKSHVRSMGRVVLTLHAPLLNRFSIGCLDGVEPEANFLLKMFRSDWGWACGRAQAGIRDRRCGREFAAGLASAPEGVQARAALGSCGLPTRGSETYRG